MYICFTWTTSSQTSSSRNVKRRNQKLDLSQQTTKQSKEEKQVLVRQTCVLGECWEDVQLIGNMGVTLLSHIRHDALLIKLSFVKVNMHREQKKAQLGSDSFHSWTQRTERTTLKCFKNGSFSSPEILAQKIWDYFHEVTLKLTLITRGADVNDKAYCVW